eukprot:COSAG05_NODE_6013_length_1041_cov_1.177282_2_plen_56_part_00
MYSTCGGCADWDDLNGAMKLAVEAVGCAGASRAIASMLAPLLATLVVALFSWVDL